MTDPGHYEKEYINLYSITKFIKHIFTYFVKWREPDFKFKEMMENDNSSFTEDLEDILEKIQPVLLEKMADYANSLANVSKHNSIDVNKKNLTNETEDQVENNKQTISQTLTEDVIESYENEFENLILTDETYMEFNKLQFLTKDHETNRFCKFCLVKKVFYFIIFI